MIGTKVKKVSKAARVKPALGAASVGSPATVTLERREWEEMQETLRQEMDKSIELAQKNRDLQEKVKELAELNDRLRFQRDEYFKTKEDYRGVIAGLSNPFR